MQNEKMPVDAKVVVKIEFDPKTGTIDLSGPQNEPLMVYLLHKAMRIVDNALGAPSKPQIVPAPSNFDPHKLGK